MKKYMQLYIYTQTQKYIIEGKNMFIRKNKRKKYCLENKMFVCPQKEHEQNTRNAGDPCHRFRPRVFDNRNDPKDEWFSGLPFEVCNAKVQAQRF